MYTYMPGFGWHAARKPRTARSMQVHGIRCEGLRLQASGFRV